MISPLPYEHTDFSKAQEIPLFPVLVAFFALCVVIFMVSLESKESLKSSRTTHTINIIIDDKPSYAKEFEQQLQYFSEQLTDTFGVPENRAKQYALWIIDATELTGTDRYLLAGLFMQESRFNPNAVSVVGAIGLGQIRPVFWEGNCSGDIFQVEGNIHCSAEILSHYREEYCEMSWDCALRTYNVGPTGLRQSWELKKSSWRYMVRVKGHARKLRSKKFQLAST